MVMNGDCYCDADLAAAWAWHEAVAVGAPRSSSRRCADTSRFGRVELREDGSICRFLEKQDRRRAGAGSTRESICFPARASRRSRQATPLSLERDVFPGWVGPGPAGPPDARPFS